VEAIMAGSLKDDVGRALAPHRQRLREDASDHATYAVESVSEDVVRVIWNRSGSLRRQRLDECRRILTDAGFALSASTTDWIASFDVRRKTPS
jgi:hypothetical protein